MSRSVKKVSQKPFNLVVVLQEGRLAYEALLLAASFRLTNPDFPGRLIFAEPSGPKWPQDPRLKPGPLRDRLAELGAEFITFENRDFGAGYPIGNKIEALLAMPEEPFLFLDTDTLITGPLSGLKLDFNKPSASMRREGTWPTIELYGPGYTETWKSLYDRFGLDFASSLDLSQPDEHWERYLYFNSGWFFYKNPRPFGQRFLNYARVVYDDKPDALVCQEIWPWLDQITLPLVVHSFGGGRPGKGLAGLDGDLTCHYRLIPLIYARESDHCVEILEEVATQKENRRLLREWEPVKRMVYRNEGKKVRAMFDRDHLPTVERPIRKTLRRAGYWLR